MLRASFIQFFTKNLEGLYKGKSKNQNIKIK